MTRAGGVLFGALWLLAACEASVQLDNSYSQSAPLPGGKNFVVSEIHNRSGGVFIRSAEVLEQKGSGTRVASFKDVDSVQVASIGDLSIEVCADKRPTSRLDRVTLTSGAALDVSYSCDVTEERDQAEKVAAAAAKKARPSVEAPYTTTETMIDVNGRKTHRREYSGSPPPEVAEALEKQGYQRR